MSGHRPLIAALLARCRFPPPPTAVHCAVSGGADSLALLVLAAAAGLDVTAIHVDHGLRAESGSEVALVSTVARQVGAAFQARQVALDPGPNLEARARRARYGVLPEGVMTGHTADDHAETILVNLIRGAGLDGLAPFRDESRARHPLLALRRWETRALCRAVDVTPFEDPSNTDRRFTRNRVRHDVLPLLAEIGRRDPVPILVRQAELLGAEASFLDTLAAAVDPTDAKAAAAAPDVVARRAIRSWLRATEAERHPPSAAEVERVLDVVHGRAVGCELTGGRQVRRSGGRLTVTSSPGEPVPAGPAGPAGPVGPADPAG